MKKLFSLRSFAVVFTVFLSLSFASGIAFSQQSLGAINGTVKDSSGAAVSGASVKMRNVATNLEQSARSKNDGSYSVVDLPIGTYVVTISKDGFRTEEHSQILVRGNLTTTVDASLQPGAVTSTVTVNGTPLLNETDTTNGFTLSEQEIAAAPLGTGSFTQLAILAQGVNSDLLGVRGQTPGSATRI